MAQLRTRDLEKRFGDHVAVRGASVTFEPGQIHAVVGENGAGKSTLLNMAAGLLVPDRGVVEVDGKPLRPHTAAEAIARGVGLVAQHFQLIEALTALENVVLGVEPLRYGFVLDEPTARKRLRAVARELDMEVPEDELVADLDVGARQRLEIARVLFRDAQIVILDEPTAVLTPQESTALYERLRGLATRGRAVVVVTHKLDEVIAHADVATVLRRGAIVATRSIEKTAEMRALLNADVMGHGASDEALAKAAPKDDVALRLDAVRRGRLGPISLSVRAGEIVGVAGIEGSGQRELFEVLGGLASPDAGAMEARDGVSVLHGDRHEEGLVLDATLEDNVLLGELGRFAKGPLLDLTAVAREADRRLGASGATPKARDVLARALSGGNQQKIVVERALARTVAGGGTRRVLCIAHPTRGVDIGAQAEIHARLVEAARAGCALLVASSDLDELRLLCHRLVVLENGKLRGELPPTATNEEIGARMLGGASAEAPR